MKATEEKPSFPITMKFMTVPHELRWYVLFVRSNQEKRVALGLSERGIDHLLPSYSSVRQWKDRRVKLDLPLFPGYLFVHLPLPERMRALTIPNVVSLIGRKDAPTPVSDEEIAWIRKGTEHGCAAPHHRLQVGQRVMITSGPMAGLQGILLREQNQTRVVVSIDSIWRAFVVDVDAACVEPVRHPGVSAPPAGTHSTQHCRAAIAGSIPNSVG